MFPWPCDQVMWFLSVLPRDRHLQFGRNIWTIMLKIGKYQNAYKVHFKVLGFWHALQRKESKDEVAFFLLFISTCLIRYMHIREGNDKHWVQYISTYIEYGLCPRTRAIYRSSKFSVEARDKLSVGSIIEYACLAFFLLFIAQHDKRPFHCMIIGNFFFVALSIAVPFPIIRPSDLYFYT